MHIEESLEKPKPSNRGHFQKGNKLGRKFEKGRPDRKSTSKPIPKKTPHSNENMDSTGDSICNEGRDINTLPIALQDGKEGEIIDSIVFTDGSKGKMTLYLIKKGYYFKLKVFLNNNLEIKPMTINGEPSAQAFWKFIKSNTKQGV